jgi:hypothetical protein
MLLLLELLLLLLGRSVMPAACALRRMTSLAASDHPAGTDKQ